MIPDAPQATADQDIARQHVEPMLRGWKDISSYLEISPYRAQERAKRARDPIPVFHDHRGPFAYTSALREWVARSRLAYQAHLELAKRRLFKRGAAGHGSDASR